MEVKPGYKKTEVGVIPEEWDAVPLKGKVGIAHGFAFASEHFASHGPYRLATPGHFYEAGGFRDIGEKQKYYVGPVPSDYVLQPGDVIVAMTEQADGLLGSAAVIPEEHGYLHNQRLGRVTVLSSEIQLDYLVHVFNSPGYRTKVRETAAGTKVKHTSPEKLLEISVRLPPLPEQRAIATALSDVDGLLDGLDRLIAKKRDLKEAAMQQLLTGQTRLPGFTGEWEVKRLRDIVQCSPSGTYGVERQMPTLLPMPVATTAQISDTDRWNGKAMQTRFFTTLQVTTYGVLRGDLVVVKSSGSAASIQSGKMVLVDESLAGTFLFSNFLMRLRPTGISAKFLYFFLTSSPIKSMLPSLCEASTYPNIRINEYLEIEICVPHSEEQTAIAEVLTEMDAELAGLEQRREKTRALKQGMMQELLTGRTRLV
jgi:type I restriction enzyme S subunit